MTKTPTTLAKPVPKSSNKAAALAFAEGGTAASKPEASKVETVRLNANIPAELHKKLKLKAVEEGTTIGDLIEAWIRSL